jgi:hypothetical protein
MMGRLKETRDGFRSFECSPSHQCKLHVSLCGGDTRWSLVEPRENTVSTVIFFSSAVSHQSSSFWETLVLYDLYNI